MKTAAKILIMTLLFGSMTAMFSCSDDPEDPEPVLSTETDILTFTINNFQTGAATIDATSHTVAVEVANGTNLGGLLAEFTISAGATSDPATGTIKDYTNPVTITVTAEDGTTTQAWTITVTEAPPGLSAATDILAFSIPEQTSIEGDANTHTIDVVVAIGTNLGALTPVFTLSSGATSDPATGIEDDYTSPVTITVTAEDATTTEDWVVTVTEGGGSTAADILSFSFPEQTDPATIDATSGNIDVQVANGTILTALTPTFTLSEGANSSPATGTSGNYSGDVTITVTAEDGSTTRDWIVHVTEPPVGGSTATDILTFTFPEQSGDADIDATNHTVDIKVVNGTALTALTPAFTLSLNATSTPATGTSENYSSAVTITVTAEDGETIQAWTVNVTEAADAGATTVVFGDGGTKATGITDLIVDGVVYDVEFREANAIEIYGTYPGTLTFDTESEADGAVNAINAELDNAGVLDVGEAEGSLVTELYKIGYEAFLFAGVENIRIKYGVRRNSNWILGSAESSLWEDDQVIFAEFTKK